MRKGGQKGVQKKRTIFEKHGEEWGKERGTGQDEEQHGVEFATWQYGVQKGRSECPGQECVQYLLPLDKDGKYNVVGIIRRLKDRFQRRLPVRGRPAEGRRRAKSFRDAADVGTRVMKVSLQPLPDVEDRRSVLAAGEEEVDFLMRALMSTGPFMPDVMPGA